MHQATRVRFRGGDPLALTKRIQARREANVELDRVFGGEEGISPIRFRPVHSYLDEIADLRQARPEPYRPTFRDHVRDVFEILGGVAVMLLIIAGLWMWAAILAVAQ